jgi:cysteinyl-tRNA synthetase
MKLYNSLTKQIEDFKPTSGQIAIYSCGPTVYERAHIGNLASFIYTDTLHRALKLAFPDHAIKHVMNITDVDDKTITASRNKYPELPPMEALKKLTNEYETLFMHDLEALGVDIKAITFARATENIEQMKELIKKLIESGIAYQADDGIYFSIEKYKQAGKIYGQLVEVTAESTGQARVKNDEYDKESIHDFALWKSQKEDEPAWDFEIDGQNIKGRPGWHIECSAMSVNELGQPFDIHTGGVDLKFPHHENEIAQSTANNGDLLARVFFHSEHLLVDSKKMSKSLNNFYTLQDVIDKGFDPLAFRLFVLQSHYRSQTHFSWKNLEAAQNRFRNWKSATDLMWQEDIAVDTGVRVDTYESKILNALENDINTPDLIAATDEAFNRIRELHICQPCIENICETFYQLSGIDLLKESKDISSEQKQLLTEREDVRKAGDYAKSDELREKLKEQGIEINDTQNGPIWSRA